MYDKYAIGRHLFIYLFIHLKIKFGCSFVMFILEFCNLFSNISGNCLDTPNFSIVGVSVAPGFDYNDLKTAPYGCLMEL